MNKKLRKFLIIIAIVAVIAFLLTQFSQTSIVKDSVNGFMAGLHDGLHNK